MTHLSVIIIHYNTKTETDACLRSVAKSVAKGFRYSVVVVDNASLEAYTLPDDVPSDTFEIVRSASNLGFTGGNNLGIQYAIEKYNSEYLVLLNSDTELDSQCLTHLYQVAAHTPKCGLVSPKIYFSKGSEFHEGYSKQDQGKIIWYAGGSIDWLHLAAFHRGVDEVDRGHFDRQHESDFATGCCVLIRREVLEKIGLFDPRYFLYLEDVDLSVRTRTVGYALAFCPEALVWHKNAGSSGGSGSSLQEYYQTRNRLYFAFKHGDWRIRLTASRLLLRFLLSGTSAQRLAALHVITGTFGKQAVV